MNFGFSELMVILVIALLLFGVGRISKIGGELGRGISSFREGLKGDQDKDDSIKDEPEKEKWD
ncbi:MAG: twin-arginine translocase TatA/TatE family subunit [Anaerolineales bacterium]|nr:twin-arginine translocase TatA/TatE family subunit [Anaerolineales bacterium]